VGTYSLSKEILAKHLNKRGRQWCAVPLTHLVCRGCCNYNHLPSGSDYAAATADNGDDRNDGYKACYGQYFICINCLNVFKDKNNTMLYLST
jgi:hypothetical protein